MEWLFQLNVYYFQQKSIIPIIQNIDLSLLLVLIGVVVITQLLLFDKINQYLNLVIFPIITSVCYPLFGYLAVFLGMSTDQFLLSELWPNFLKVLPLLIAVVLLFKLISFPLFKLTKENGYLSGGLVAPLLEEFFYRVILINSIVINDIPLFHAVFFASFIFGIGHISQIRGGKWWGGSAINYALVMGFIFGFIALYYGILVAIVLHSIGNIVNRLIASKKENPELLGKNDNDNLSSKA